ncbi:MAG: hypothetical protein HRU70_09950 [Phycisphaeraceae bacterium]|nr:MAG: hypothetical protein HRU70_09950 [Phycisphaeraceae bacterium]
MQMKNLMVASAAALFASAGSAFAFVPWANPSGNGSNFAWDNGGSDNGLFGSPTLVNGDTFVFFPQNFRAESTNGVAASVGDRLQFDIIVNTGFFLSGIRIAEFGDYGIVGQGGSVGAGGTLFVTNLNTFDVRFDDILTTPGSPINTPGFGNWRGDANVDLSDASPQWTRVRVVLNNNLFAVSTPDGVAFIEKKVFGSGIAIQIVPAPGSAGVLALAGLVAIRRRR